MHRSRPLLAALRRSSSLLTPRRSQSKSLLLNQVNHHHHELHSLPSVSNFELNRISSIHLVNLQKKVLFCTSPATRTSPDSLVSLIAGSDWSDDVESDLERFKSELSFETVVYVVRRLDKEPRKACAFFNWVFEKNGFKPNIVVGSLILRILVCKDMVSFWATLRKLKERGVNIDAETYVTLLGALKKEKMEKDAKILKEFYFKMVNADVVDKVVKNVVKVVVDSQWTAGVKRTLEALVRESLSGDFVLRVLRDLRNEPEKALVFFQWVEEFPGYEHITVTYNALLRTLCHANDEGYVSMNEFWKILEEMKSKGCQMDIDTFIKVSRSLQEFEMFEDAVELYEFMMDSPYKPSEQDCTLLLRNIASYDQPDMDLMMRVIRKYEASGNNYTKAVFDMIHRALTNLGEIEKAGKVLDTMKNAGFEPDNITFSQVLHGLCKAQRLEEACKVLDEMESNGCVPDIKTWTILINGHCEAGEFDKALECLTKMMGGNIDPDAHVLDVFIKGFVSHGKVDRADLFIKDTVSKLGLRPRQATYKLLIEELLKDRKFKEALDLVVVMVQQDYPSCPEPFIKYISKHGTVADALDFLNNRSSKAKPSITPYVNIFKSFICEGKFSDATDLLNKCPVRVQNDSRIRKLFAFESNTTEGDTKLVSAL